MAEINDRLKAIYEEKGMTYGEFSQRTGISRGLLQKYVTGKITGIPIDKVKLMAKGLGVSAAYLMGWDEKQDAAPEDPQLTVDDYEAQGISARVVKKPKLRTTPTLPGDINELIAQLELIRDSAPASDSEKELIQIFRKLPAESQETILRVAKGFVHDNDLD